MLVAYAYNISDTIYISGHRAPNAHFLVFQLPGHDLPRAQMLTREPSVSFRSPHGPPIIVTQIILKIGSDHYLLKHINKIAEP